MLCLRGRSGVPGRFPQTRMSVDRSAGAASIATSHFTRAPVDAVSASAGRPRGALGRSVGMTRSIAARSACASQTGSALITSLPHLSGHRRAIGLQTQQPQETLTSGGRREAFDGMSSKDYAKLSRSVHPNHTTQESCEQRMFE